FKLNYNDGHCNEIKVFTTRPDTLFGVTYLVIAPEHELVKELLNSVSNKEEVEAYIQTTKAKSEIDRTDATKEKTGVELKGVKVINPANNEEVPVWIADYVLADYGTGAVMAVPQHDDRDKDFANKFNLPFKDVPFATEEQINKVAKKVVKYKLREWVFSRQRYWGEPIPVYHDGDTIIPASEKELPIELPPVEFYEPTDTGESPLANISDWVNVEKDGKKLRRETNTMPQWAGSSWYYLRYMDPQNDNALVDPAKEKYWNEVDLYVGGAEHATRHLIYARFWHKFLFDIGVVSTIEPFKKLQAVGLIMADDGRKMSKRWGNVINPDEMVETFGADAMRLYEMFMGPFNQAINWNTNGLVGTRRFVEKVWRLKEKVEASKGIFDHQNVSSSLNKTIKKVTEDIAEMRFNTAISQMMILVNELEKEEKISKNDFETLLKILAPFAPHITEELWAQLENKTSIHLESWPEADLSKVEDEEVKMVVQVNGKVREIAVFPKDASEETVKTAVTALPGVIKWVGGKEISKVIFIKNKIINLLVDL
ncbi:MAG: class I tRNA ligase family protein, partial [Candidatus Paceibacterota bacterium]